MSLSASERLLACSFEFVFWYPFAGADSGGALEVSSLGGVGTCIAVPSSGAAPGGVIFGSRLLPNCGMTSSASSISSKGVGSDGASNCLGEITFSSLCEDEKTNGLSSSSSAITGSLSSIATGSEIVCPPTILSGAFSRTISSEEILADATFVTPKKISVRNVNGSGSATKATGSNLCSIAKASASSSVSFATAAMYVRPPVRSKSNTRSATSYGVAPSSAAEISSSVVCAVSIARNLI